jgi:hypothetical protein
MKEIKLKDITEFKKLTTAYLINSRPYPKKMVRVDKRNNALVITDNEKFPLLSEYISMYHENLDFSITLFEFIEKSAEIDPLKRLLKHFSYMCSGRCSWRIIDEKLCAFCKYCSESIYEIDIFDNGRLYGERFSPTYYILPNELYSFNETHNYIDNLITKYNNKL